MQMTFFTLVLGFALLFAGESSSLRHVQVTSHVKNHNTHVQHRTTSVLGNREDATDGERAKAHALSQARASAEEEASESTDLTLGSMVTALLRGEGPSLHDVMKAAEGKMTRQDAMRRLHGKLPTDVAAIMLAHNNGTTPAKPTKLTEESMLKALHILNDLIEQAWKKLDDLIIACKEFQERNRGTFDQVMTDLARLGEQIADLERQRAEANEGISLKDEQFKAVLEEMSTQDQLYWEQQKENAKELEIRKNDLAVFQFIMQITECDPALLQVGGTNSAAPAGVRICPANAGGLELRFNDPKLEAEAERRMTAGARKAIREMLARINTQTALLSTDAHAAQRYLPATPVKTAPNPDGQWKKCVDGTPNCGLLHDMLSLHWGKFKDLVDELQAEMDKNEASWKTLMANFNEQLNVIRVGKMRLSMMLAEVISNLNADHEETIEKEQERAELDSKYSEKMRECKAKIEEILFTNMCGVRRVRNEVMSYSEKIKPEDIVDCDVSDWLPGTCTVICDDKCPPKHPDVNPYECGGWMTISRTVVVYNNTHGVKCPATDRIKKCNQQKCEVDCVMSDWSDWGTCTKECESGVQSRTRDVITKPKNGGRSCDNVQEPRPCNTGSCDRDCTIQDWTSWTPCSMACSGGLQERVRNVLVPLRGNGKCPKADSEMRLNEQACNEQPCIGDEICIANQDLILAIDGSGSLREDGFTTLRDFAAVLIDRYQSKYYGDGKMKVGVIQFGNGKVDDEGKVSPAILVHKLTDELEGVKTSISALKWQKGFTNMAQAFTLAEQMFQLGGRETAQSAVAVLTDGHPSFLWQTSQQIRKLKDQNVKLFFAPIMIESTTKRPTGGLKLMMEWASQPWETHLVHIPGLLALAADPTVFVEKIVATFCPEAMSPSATMEEEKKVGYMLVHEQGRCGQQGKLLSVTAGTVGECAALANQAGKKSFGFTSQIYSWFAKSIYAEGMRAPTRCYAEEMDVTQEQFDAWALPAGRGDPPCADGWKMDYFSDFYALEPIGA